MQPQSWLASKLNSHEPKMPALVHEKGIFTVKIMNKKWQDEKKAIKATQVAFDISTEVQSLIKQEALTHNLNPPDQIRKLLGLPYNKKPVRPRLTVTLKPEDFEILAEKYDVDVHDQAAIRECVSEELIRFAKSKGVKK